MKRPNRPNYEKMYPTASPEIIAYLRTSDRQMEYQSYDLKVERYTVNQEEQTVTFIPSREDSLERLMENDMQFQTQMESVESATIRRVMIDKLHIVLKKLNVDEIELIHALFFEEISETALAESLGVNQSTISRRKDKILAKIKKLLKN